MFDKYLICETGFSNVEKDGRVIGFRFGARLPYYRGLGLSMVEAVDVTIDGETMPRSATRLTVHGNTYTIDALESEYEDRWEMDEVAIVTVERPGGLKPGQHKIEHFEQLPVSYL